MVVTALVVASPGSHPSETELLAFCRDRLAPHQVPASISTVDSLPRNAVGKLLRTELPRLAGGEP
jgi:long-chain acyl-CoA synthetase